jgi:hypothetical protein
MRIKIISRTFHSPVLEPAMIEREKREKLNLRNFKVNLIASCAETIHLYVNFRNNLISSLCAILL